MHPDGIKKRREALGISQQQLAGAAECSIAMVRLVEGGYMADRPSPTLARIRDALDDLEKKESAA